MTAMTAPPPRKVLAAGQPVFARMPEAVEWWPTHAPWRVCQESAALISCSATRRVLCARSAATAQALLQRTTELAALRAHAARGELSGVDELLLGGVATLPPWGAVVLALPPSPTRPHLAVAALLAESGMVLLASDEVIERYRLALVP